MSDALASFIAQRLRELDSEARSMEARIRKLEDERADLEKAGRAVGLDHLFDYNADTAAAQEAVAASARRSGKVAPERTIKEAVIEILGGSRRGMVALDILAGINERFGFDYPRTSLSPQLSRLKAEGRLEREGMIWRLAGAGPQTNKAADDQPMADTSTASGSQPVSPLAPGHQARSSEPSEEVGHSSSMMD